MPDRPVTPEQTIQRLRERLRTRASGSRADWITVREPEWDALLAVAEALNDTHEFHCGCDHPGDPSTCVAKPEGAFAALARLSGGRPGG